MCVVPLVYVFVHCRGRVVVARMQSCCNHSCAPSAEAAKSQEVTTAAQVAGDAVLVATRDIAAGEEITLSYVDWSLSSCVFSFLHMDSDG